MCGLVGIYHFDENKEGIKRDILINMLRPIAHRGPDEFGIYISNDVGLGSARLSIIDLKTGSQPVYNEDKTKWVVFTGEIYNYKELRSQLIHAGHRFYSKGDTEVIVHLYEELGIKFIDRLNGQFAIAIWDSVEKKLILIRDRMGVRPLFYSIRNGKLHFASEVKSIFSDRQIARQLDLKGLDQILTFWTTIDKTSVFDGICELPPGHALIIQNKNVRILKYWDMTFPSIPEYKTKEECIEAVRYHLLKSVNLRLGSDVPVGLSLSGGIDSSIIASTLYSLDIDFNHLKSFSVRFEDQDYDEFPYQDMILKKYPMQNNFVKCSDRDIGNIFPQVVWHAETPLFRTAPAPLYLLSRQVQKENIKVILSGEGADEIFWGYYTFQEQKIRLFWSKFPHSSIRPQLLRKILPHIFPHFSPFDKNYFNIIKNLYQKSLKGTSHVFYSHLPRWINGEIIKEYYSSDVKSQLKDYSVLEHMKTLLPHEYLSWDPLQRNQYLEIKTLLKGYLLSSQGDRMLMAHSVEGRYPFLDNHLIAEVAKMPSNYKVFGLTDKYILRESFKDDLPREIYKRSKFPYLSPDASCFFGNPDIEYINDLLTTKNIEKAGYFNAKAIAELISRVKSVPSNAISYWDNMASVIIISTMLLHDLFIQNFKISSTLITLSKEYDFRG